MDKTSVLARVVERCRNALLIETTSDLVIFANIKGDSFEVIFYTGESAVLSM